VKPENVLVTATGQIKVSDFGLAKDQNLDPLTMEGSFIGTPLYMAPEIGREQVDGRADIYSLGVCFYYLLTGVQPFREFSGMEILRAIAHDKLRAPETHLPDIPADHRRVLGKMLEKSRDQRYLEMGSVIRDLEALLRGQPVSAGEPALWGPLASGAGKGQGKGEDGDKITRQSQRLKRSQRESVPTSRDPLATSGKGVLASLGSVPPVQLLALGAAFFLVLGLLSVLLGVVLGLV
jgi:serine/threonine protein kinase